MLIMFSFFCFLCGLWNLPLTFLACLGLRGGQFSIAVPETQEGGKTPERKCDPLTPKKFCHCYFLWISLRSFGSTHPLQAWVAVLFKVRGRVLYRLLARMSELSQALSRHIVQLSMVLEKGHPWPMPYHGLQGANCLQAWALTHPVLVSGHSTESLFPGKCLLWNRQSPSKNEQTEQSQVLILSSDGHKPKFK